jgi:hypothetical protein
MPRRVIRYHCTICNNGPMSFEEAKKCEQLENVPILLKEGTKISGHLFIELKDTDWVILSVKYALLKLGGNIPNKHIPMYTIESLSGMICKEVSQDLLLGWVV